MTPDLLSAVVRSLAFVALFQAAGVAFFLALFGRSLTNAMASTRRLGVISAALGVLLILAQLSLDAARMAGDFDGVWDLNLQHLALESKSGASALVKAAGLLVIFLALWPRPQTRTVWAGIGAVIAVAGFLLTGHTSTHPLRGVLVPLLATHLLVVAFWFGSLLPLMFVLGVEPRAIAAHILTKFSVAASWLVPLILLAGAAIAWILAGSLAVLRRPYGELLLVKVAGFALLMLLASYNKWRLTPALASGGAVSPLRRSIIAEYVLVVAVMSVTVMLTSFYSPE